jgi:alcohol dehydrogenase (cytochrome c)
MNWYFQYTPGDHWDFDEIGTHILIDGAVNGEQRRLITHSARNGFLYTIERANGQVVVAKPYLEKVNWTKGIDQKTGKPVDYDPSKDVQTYAGVAAPTPQDRTRHMCPSPSGGNNFFPSTYSQRTKQMYIPALTPCADLTNDPNLSNKAGDWKGGTYKAERYETNFTMADPFTGEVKKVTHVNYPNYGGALSTAGGLVFTGYTDGTFVAYDDTSLEPLWKINMGVGFNAPPMTFEVGGKQYVAILAGLSRIAIGKHALIPELKEQRNQTMLFVFGL